MGESKQIIQTHLQAHRAQDQRTGKWYVKIDNPAHDLDQCLKRAGTIIIGDTIATGTTLNGVLQYIDQRVQAQTRVFIFSIAGSEQAVTKKAISEKWTHLKLSITYANLMFRLNEENGTDLEWIGATHWNEQAKKLIENHPQIKFTDQWKKYLKCSIWDWGDRFGNIREHLENVKNHFQGLGMVSGWNTDMETNREWMLTETMRRIRVMEEDSRTKKKKEQQEEDEGKEFTQEELKNYDGVKNAAVYVAVKGCVYDVTPKKGLYGPGGSYHYLAGRDASRVLHAARMTSSRHASVRADANNCNQQIC